MVKPELGTKRACPSCQSRFYDLNRDPIVCPICGTSFFAEALLPSKADHPAPAQPKPQPIVVKPRDDDVELVSLEDVKEDADDGDDIEDVEIEGDDDAADDTFLEEEEEGEEGVTGLIGGKEDEEEV